ncbi:MAG: hypothetical protein M1816_006646 [Peltula sp. TS41687]|nr:MAG: hypothetical protein M1816_006646 [Peltula sp. TS41687]
MAHNSTSYLLGPALKPPPGVTPNFVDPPTLRPYLIGTAVACGSVSGLFVLLRMYTKVFISRSFGWDDGFSFLGWIGSIAYMAVACMAGHYGSGTHQWNVRVINVMKVLEWANYAQLLYGPVVVFVKVAILLQFKRIFVVTKRSPMSYAIDIVLWLMVAFYFADLIVEIFHCIPREKIWNHQVPGRCVNINAALLATGVANALTDIIILILPMYPIYHLQISNKRKLGVAAIFATGLLACITSIVRLYLSVEFLHDPDVMYNLGPLGLWTFAEIAIGILVGCLPVLPRFVQHIGSQIKSSRLQSDSSSKSGNAQLINNLKRDDIRPAPARYVPLGERELTELSTAMIEAGDRGKSGQGDHSIAAGDDMEGEQKLSIMGIRATTRIETSLKEPKREV